MGHLGETYKIPRARCWSRACMFDDPVEFVNAGLNLQQAEAKKASKGVPKIVLDQRYHLPTSCKPSDYSVMMSNQLPDASFRALSLFPTTYLDRKQFLHFNVRVTPLMNVFSSLLNLESLSHCLLNLLLRHWCASWIHLCTPRAHT